MSCYGNTALALSILSVIFCVISFVVPYWLMSWEQKQSTFHRIGLWEVCFTAFTDPKQYAYRYYAGCWWIFHSELDDVRDMLNPAWFKAVQAFAVIALLNTFVTLFFLLAGRCTDNSSIRTCGYGGASTFAVFTAISSLMCVLIFGACAKDPRLYRLPMPQYNYFGFGYALMIMCTLASGFCFAFLLGAMSHKSKGENDRYKQ